MFYWIAYQDLCSERPTGGYVSIPYSKIMEYADRNKCSSDDLKKVIWAVDRDYLKYLRGRAKAEAEQNRVQRQNMMPQGKESYGR